jgi:ribonuclease-3
VKIDLEPLERRLGYTFGNKQLLRQALTHRSADLNNYERFEFVGDSILNFVIGTRLFHQFPSYSEGQLSRLRSYLVRGEMLGEVGAQLGLGEHLILGPGELKSGGFRRSSILADSLEAIFAAVFFDGGVQAAEQVILTLFQSRLESSNLEESFKDAKTQLQESLQSQKLALPEYELTEVEGEGHDQVFHICCTVNLKNQRVQTSAQGSTRKKAEQLAALRMLEQIQILI